MNEVLTTHQLHRLRDVLYLHMEQQKSKASQLLSASCQQHPDLIMDAVWTTYNLVKQELEQDEFLMRRLEDLCDTKSDLAVVG